MHLSCLLLALHLGSPIRASRMGSHGAIKSTPFGIRPLGSNISQSNECFVQTKEHSQECLASFDITGFQIDEPEELLGQLFYTRQPASTHKVVFQFTNSLHRFGRIRIGRSAVCCRS